MNLSHGYRILFICILLAFGALAPTSAVTISPLPDHLREGDSLSLSLQDLDDGTIFSFTIQGIYPADPGKDLVFIVRDFEMPYILQEGEILVRVENVKYTEFSLKKGDTIAGMASSPENGTFIRSESRTITSGLYEYIILKAAPLNGDEPVTSTICMRGIKKGPKDALITFTPEGITSGTIQVKIEVNGTVEMEDELFIGAIPATESVAPSQTTPEAILTVMCAIAMASLGLNRIRQ
jgi:hypothetical protein